MFKIVKIVIKANQDIIGEQYIRNDAGVLAVRDKDIYLFIIYLFFI